MDRTTYLEIVFRNCIWQEKNKKKAVAAENYWDIIFEPEAE